MEIDQLTNILSSSGMGGFMVIILVMIYRSGTFLAPLVVGYVNQQTANQANIAKTLEELTKLQKIANVRLEAIEKQLSIFEGLG